MGKPFKIILFLFALILSIFNFKNISFANDETYFIVTAYYSPLPNQKHYTTGSYWGDKRLNGEGHTTASGKPVKPGILAAPTKYPFGTKIYFEGFGVGVVEDRGGAIVKAGVKGHAYDRIDIWMGYGDEGLMRAKKWGTRTIRAKIVSTTTPLSLKFSQNILQNIENIKVNPENHPAIDTKKLQETFKKFGLYNGNIDGKYESIKDSLIDFQLKNKIIKSKNDEAAGRFGPKTFVALLKKYGSPSPLVKQNSIETQQASPKVQIILNAPEIKLNGDKPQEDETKKVQELFKKLGMYDGAVDGDYSKIRRILLDFQKKAGIIKKDNDWGAGYFGEKTKAALIIYFEELWEKELNRRRFESLPPEEKQKLKLVLNKINIYINKKSKGNAHRKKIITKSLVKKIKLLSQKIKDNKIKTRLHYIKESLS